jgi:hypothetical protein
MHEGLIHDLMRRSGGPCIAAIAPCTHAAYVVGEQALHRILEVRKRPRVVLSDDLRAVTREELSLPPVRMCYVRGRGLAAGTRHRRHSSR